jgi:hypothetical protein
MPNLAGLSAGDALDYFSEVDVNIKIFGTGSIARQVPEENEPINSKSSIELYLK